MKKTLMLKVTHSISEVMETMFNCMIQETRFTGPSLPGMFDIQETRACRITFSGKNSGAIFLLIPRKVLITMTQNFMGEAINPLSEEITDGTLKEALNMIAGHALTRLDEQSYMGLGIPQIVDASALSMDEDGILLNTTEGVVASFVELGD